MTFVLKSVKQTYSPGPDVLNLMDDFKSMVNHCIRVGLETDASSLRKLTALCYKDMRSNYRLIPSYYCLTAILKSCRNSSFKEEIFEERTKNEESVSPKTDFGFLLSFQN